MMTATILDKIVAEKRREVEQQKRILPVSALEERIARRHGKFDFAAALKGDSVKLIAEVKKASPSKGLLCPDFNPVALAKTYAQGGAAAISVLTEVNHFQGSLEYLALIRNEVSIPLLRKDFIFDPYQVYESVAFGADALLLIVAILHQQRLEELLVLSRRLGMECLVEVHDEGEVKKALLSGAEIVGINNRDLNTFTVDIDTTRRLRPLISEGRVVVSESGIKNRDDMNRLKDWGVDAVLVGEVLVTAANIPVRMEELML